MQAGRIERSRLPLAQSPQRLGRLPPPHCARLGRGGSCTSMSRVILALLSAALFVVGGAAADDQSGDAAKGKEAFQQRCLVCHFEDSAEKKIGPGLAGIKEGTLPSGKESTFENVLENLNKGGNGMPAFEQMLSDEEKSDIAAYVLSL
ncbi:MAG: cytochrome c [Acidobacteriia bacterium]|nr:cytochrome c [Terriglobia bacterium]